MLDEAGKPKDGCGRLCIRARRKKFVKTIKAIRKCAPNEKAVNDCEEYLLNNWAGAVRRMQDKNVYGCSAEGHVSHMYSDRMSSRPMGWSEAGADAMCQLRCYVKDYGEDPGTGKVPPEPQAGRNGNRGGYQCVQTGDT